MNSKIIEKIEEMLPDVTDFIIAESNRLLTSGLLDLDSYDPEEYVLSKILLVVALRNCADQYMPVSKEYQKAIKHLSHF